MSNGITTGLAFVMAVTLGTAASAAPTASAHSSGQAARHFIVEADSTSAALRLVRSLGGHVSRPLPIIHAVAADLYPWEAEKLKRLSRVRVYDDRRVTTSATNKQTAQMMATVAAAQSSFATGATNSPPVQFLSSNSAPDTAAMVGAPALHAAGTTGTGVTIAMLDTGFSPETKPKFSYDKWGTRVLATVDFTTTQGGTAVTDAYGHGTHITSIAGSAARGSSGAFYGVAPGASFVIVRAFDADGGGSYSDVISGLNWIIAKKATYNIRIVNLSLGATPQSYYWDDPLNQAVMAAWQAGIVVVVAAGNDGPAAQTIDVPGNVPYVITVGAMSDNHTPANATDDHLASFSSTGPTYEGFVKPEVIAPGGHVLASMPNTSALATEIFGTITDPYTQFPLSGTSMATAVTSGVVALLLQQQPSLTPDEVKCKLMAGAAPAITSTGTLAYSVFQQGAGLINAMGAINTSATGCANQGLNISADLAGTTHFGGPANQDASGNFYIMDMTSSTPFAEDPTDGFTWSASFPYNQGYAWSDGYAWSKGYAWSQGYAWSKTYTWSSNAVWSQGYAWSKSLTWAAAAPSAATLSAQSLVAPFPAQEE